MKPGHALHHLCVQEDMQTDGLISHIPLPNLLMPEVKDDLRGKPESPLSTCTKDFNTNHVTFQQMFHSEVHEEVLWGCMGPSCCLPAGGTGHEFDPCKS